MAEFNIFQQKVTPIGKDTEIAALVKGLKAKKKTDAVQLALVYAKWDAKNSCFVSDDDDPLFGLFEDLMQEYPLIAFAFDVYFTDTAAGEDGDGRYFCVFEKGKAVYDAGKRAEMRSFAEVWFENEGYDFPAGSFPDCLTGWAPKQVKKKAGASDGYDVFWAYLGDDYRASAYAMDSDHDGFFLYPSLAQAKRLEETGKLHGIKDYLNKKKAKKIPCFNAEGFRWQLLN